MNKSDIVTKLKEDYPQFYKETLEQFVDFMFNWIREEVNKGNKVKLKRFGSFERVIRRYPPWNGKTTDKVVEDRPEFYYTVRFLKGDGLERVLKNKGPYRPLKNNENWRLRD